MTREEFRNAERKAKIMFEAAKIVKDGVDRRVDGYLDGTYDPKAEARKITAKGVTTSLVVLSLLTGLAFSSPSDVAQDQTEAANFRPTPVVTWKDLMNSRSGCWISAIRGGEIIAPIITPKTIPAPVVAIDSLDR